MTSYVILDGFCAKAVVWFVTRVLRLCHVLDQMHEVAQGTKRCRPIGQAYLLLCHPINGIDPRIVRIGEGQRSPHRFPSVEYREVICSKTISLIRVGEGVDRAQGPIRILGPGLYSSSHLP